MTILGPELHAEHSEPSEECVRIMTDVAEKLASGELDKSSACQYLAHVYGHRDLSREEVEYIAEQLQLLKKAT